MVDLGLNEKAAAFDDAITGHGLERGDIRVGLVVAGQAGIGRQRDTGLVGPTGPRVPVTGMTAT